MDKRVRIGLVGDFDEKIYTLVKLNEAIAHCRPHLNFSLETTWVPTETVDKKFLKQHSFHGFWVVPGSPYKNDDGVYKLIGWCRENNFPVLGTCGGFQYMAVEYARNVLGLQAAGHQESEPLAEQLVVSRLSCSLKGQQEAVSINDPHSWLYKVLQTNTIIGHFYCSYGVNPLYQNVLDHYPMVFTAFSPSGEPRALQLKTHRFFNGTLFQPPLDSTAEKPNPLILSFFNECVVM